MKNLGKKERILIIAASIILFSILLMIAVIPGVYHGTYPNRTNPAAVIGISLAILIRFILLVSFMIINKANKRDGKKRKAGYITIGILLIIFGLLYSSGAFAFSNNENIIYVAYLMFTSVFCDIIASLLIFISLFIKTPSDAL